MSDGRIRRGPLLAGLGGAALFLLLGIVFWRTIPPVIPAEAFAARTSRPFAGVPPLPSVIGTPDAAGVRVAVIEEPENVRVTAAGAYARTLEEWRRVLREAGAQFVGPADADVLVIPQARCLGPVHRRLLATHLGRGRGIVTSGLTGANDGVCTPLADTLLAQLLGLADRDIRPAPRSAEGVPYVMLLGESVLGAGMAPAPRLDLTPTSTQLAFRTRAREVFYSDYERHPLVGGGADANAAVMRAMIGPGRVAAFGFDLTEVEGTWSRAHAAMAAANAVRWAAGHHTFQLAPWPNGYKAAAVLAHDVEADYQNARQALEALAPYELPGTAFIVGRLAAADMETTRRLMATMEIGSHTWSHNPLDTLSARAHVDELTRSKRSTEQLVGRAIVGMRPPEERYTPQTLQVWADLGGQYIFANNNMRSGAPEIIPLLPDSIVLLGRVSEDDYELLNRDKIRDREEMTRRIVSQVGESVAYRGLYMFSYHSHMFAQEELLPVLTALAEKLKESPEVWTTTAGEVADWWRRRAAVRVTRAPDGAQVTLVNEGDRPFVGGRVVIHPPRGGHRTIALPTLQPGAAVTVDSLGRVSRG